MNTLLLLQFACCIITATLALSLAFSRLQMQNTSHRYEMSRWMTCAAMALLSIHYVTQMHYNLRASGDDIGAVINILFYTPASFLISYSIYNLECGVRGCKRFISIGVSGYAIVLLAFIYSYQKAGSLHIGSTLYLMLAVFLVCMIYFIITNYRSIRDNHKNIESHTGADLLPYDRYHMASLWMLYASAILICVAILSRPLLFIVGPLMLFSLYAFTLTFIGLGFKMTPLELEEVLGDTASENITASAGGAFKKKSIADMGNLPKERISEIGEAIEHWCAAGGFRDSTANIISLAHSIQVQKEELSFFFDQYIHDTFRTWINDIRFKEAQRMLKERPQCPEWTIAAECGFSSYSHLYRVFRTKTKLSPEQWKERMGI